MNRRAFESELQSYIINFFSFLKIDMEIKDQMLLLVENKLRMMEDLKKHEIYKADPVSLKGEKERQNLLREKLIYEFMVLMRSFLPYDIKSESALSDYIRSNYGINSFPDFLIILYEALVFQRDISLNDIISYYEIMPPVVDPENWDYSIDFLKEVGKDAESRKVKHIERLKERLIPFDELNSLLKLKIEGQHILHRALETQWKIADRKQKDCSHIYNDDFFTFLDECVNYFNNSFVSLLNGTRIRFEDTKLINLEGNIFSSAYFSNELKSLSDLISEMHYFRSNNPSMKVSRNETIKIIKGKIPSMSQIERFILLISDLFYQMGKELHRLYDLHRTWVFNGCLQQNTEIMTTPLERNELEEEKETGRPIPYYNCRVTDFHNSGILTKQLLGKSILTDSIKGGIFIHIIAFLYQLAYECMNENIFKKLDERKEIIRKIKDLGG